jgi:hypothetical protein
MKTTVKYSNVKYTESTREDGCKVIRCDLLAEANVWNVKNGNLMIQPDDVWSLIKNRRNKDGNILFHCVGEAVCCPDDTYDFEVGRRLAYTRAQANAFKEAARLYAEIGRRFIEDLDNTINNCMRSAVSCDFHTYEIMYGAEAEDRFVKDRFGLDSLMDEVEDSNECSVPVEA